LGVVEHGPQLSHGEAPVDRDEDGAELARGEEELDDLGAERSR
jgi:hypothetical protein